MSQRGANGDGRSHPWSWRSPRNATGNALLRHPVQTIEPALTDAQGAPRVQTARLDVNVSAHPVGMYVGALVGVILATMLVSCYRATKKRSSPERATDSESLPAEDREAPWWMRMIRGALASLIAILLFQTTSDVSFPISVTVHDFYGGVLLGLFGDKVAESIWTRI